MVWDTETTIKFIQLYKSHPCLWDFQSVDYRLKDKRNAALLAIVQEMNIDGFGVQEAKNKIKNLRSTYSQEIKKIQDSKKSGAGLSNLYNSNIKWLKEMEEVYAKELKKTVYENNNNKQINEDTSCEESGSSTVNAHQETSAQEVITVTASSNSTTTLNTKSCTGSTPRPKKRARDIVKAISDLKNLNDEMNSEEETAYDMFGKSVAMQLKGLSIENALLAQCKIQSILTEFGIKNHRERKRIASHSSLSNYSSQRPSSALSATTDLTEDAIYSLSESSTPSPAYLGNAAPSLVASSPLISPAPMTSPTDITYSTQPVPMTPSTNIIYSTQPAPMPSPTDITYSTQPVPMTSSTNIIYSTQPAPMPSPTDITYSTQPVPMTSSTNIIYSTQPAPMTSNIIYATQPAPETSPADIMYSVHTNDIISTAMNAAFDFNTRINEK